jgi:hypothetical protein
MTPFLIDLPWSSLDVDGQSPCEGLANFHTNGAPPASAAEGEKRSSDSLT